MVHHFCVLINVLLCTVIQIRQNTSKQLCFQKQLIVLIEVVSNYEITKAKTSKLLTSKIVNKQFHHKEALEPQVYVDSTNHMLQHVIVACIITLLQSSSLFVILMILQANNIQTFQLSRSKCVTTCVDQSERLII